jgi:hypothetical protein
MHRQFILPKVPKHGESTVYQPLSVHLPLLRQRHVVLAIHNHVFLDILDSLFAGNDFCSGGCRERCENVGDVTPPLLTESFVPIDSDGHAIREAGLLFPAELSELGSVDCISVIVERTIVGVLDPLVQLLLGCVRNVQVSQELRAQRQVGDLIVGSNIVDLIHLSLVQDCVESIRGISGKEISSCRCSVTVQNDWLSSVQQAAEFGNDFCKWSVN